MLLRGLTLPLAHCHVRPANSTWHSAASVNPTAPGPMPYAWFNATYGLRHQHQPRHHLQPAHCGKALGNPERTLLQQVRVTAPQLSGNAVSQASAYNAPAGGGGVTVSGEKGTPPNSHKPVPWGAGLVLVTERAGKDGVTTRVILKIAHLTMG